MAVRLTAKEWEKDPNWSRARERAGVPATAQAAPATVPARQMTDKELLVEIRKDAIRQGKVEALAKRKRGYVRRYRGEYEEQMRYGGPVRARVARASRFAGEGAERLAQPMTRRERAMVSRQMYPSQQVRSDVDYYPYERWDVDHPVSPGRFDHLQARQPQFPRSYVSSHPAVEANWRAPSSRGFTASPGAVQTGWRAPGRAYLPDYRRPLPKRSYLSGRGMLG